LQTSVINIESIRNDFPILKRKVHKDKQLIYFDNAATSQKPIQVIEAISDYYLNYNSNIHRAVHELAEEATAAYETTRDKVLLKLLTLLHIHGAGKTFTKMTL